MSSSTIVLESHDEPVQVEAAIAGGTLVIYTCRAPDKTTANEDTVAAIPYGPEAAVLVIADGAGGLPGGAVASRTAIESLQASMDHAMAETMLLRTAILNGIEAANEAVLALGNGAATTMTIVTIEGRVARSYQVGDSEAMIVGQRGRIRAQTTAHSPTGFAIEAGMLDQRDALHHEERHLVSNLIGTSDMRIEMGTGTDLNPRDTVVLASDGLMDNVHRHEITELVRKGPMSAAIRSLTGLARRRMAVETMHQPSKPDDLSIILFRKPYKKKRSAPNRE